MTDKKDDRQNDTHSNQQTIQFHVSPDLEYVYRDIFNIYVGAGDVTIEFGNIHKAMPEHASISNRIVMTVGNAYTLIQTLQKALQDSQVKLHEQLQAQKRQP